MVVNKQRVVSSFSRFISLNGGKLGNLLSPKVPLPGHSTYAVCITEGNVFKFSPLKDRTCSILGLGGCYVSGSSKTPVGLAINTKLKLDSSGLDSSCHILGAASYLTQRSFGARSAVQEPPLVEEEYESSDEGHFRRYEEDEVDFPEPSEVQVPVEAFYIARGVDLKALSQESSLNVAFHRNHIVINWKDNTIEAENVKEKNGPVDEDPKSWNDKRYMVVFQYGTVVLFNCDSSTHAPNVEEKLNVVKQYCKDILKEPRRENYAVLIRPTLDKWSQAGHDRIMVKRLDTDGIRIISLVLSQSIALDHYTIQIDGLLKTFNDLNHEMEITGTFSLKRKELFKLVATVNTAIADTILRIGLLERSDVAWQNANYDQIWEYMRDDFELEDRFESLEFKTGIIQHNVTFFLDILQNRKSDTLEWIIIFLITGEICVSVYDILRGTGAL